MKITKAKLQQLIKEEIEKVISADDLYLAEMFDTGGVGGVGSGWEEEEELQNLKKESSEEGEDEGLTHGEYFARYGSPISALALGQLEAELDELSVAIRFAREEGGVADEDIRAFVEQVLKTKKVQK